MACELIFCSATCRYIEIFRTNMNEALAAVASGGGEGGGRSGGGDRYGDGRPIPYDRNIGRFGGGPAQMRHGYMQRRGELAVHDSPIVIVISIILCRFKSLLIVLYANFLFFF